MKVKLLNDGGYGKYLVMGNIKFPVVVEVAGTYYDHGFDVSGAELIRIGAEPGHFDPEHYYFFTNKECEVIK